MQDLGRLLLFLALICAGSHVHGIINGELAPEGSMQFMVSVQNNNGHLCGGFLISEDFVVTTAHCDNDLTHVILREHNWKNSNAKKIKIMSRYKHNNYKQPGLGYDIMLLKLARKAPIGDNIKTIPLAERNMNLKDNQECSVAGWGKTESSGVPVDDLMVVNVSIINQQVCLNKWINLPANVICAGGYETNKGFCQGDSGAPLVCNGKAVGIVSFNKNFNCKYPDVPNVYTDIRGYLLWIKKILRGGMCPM
ncbi:duodenase-1 isoform X2 [Oryzias melastigma]|uniref:duodenase-1 isoform X2 n=1 Tax=Oryzias melastigma TaxID=30732 RepID=UPI00168D4352|nr:duodenase-1 isoform X2 [Oryzias melastigma]